MGEIQWIKLAVSMFDVSRKIKRIEKMKDGDTILVIWFKLLCLAGSINDGGAIYNIDEPYTTETLAEELRRPAKVVMRALAAFEQFGMIAIENGIIYLVSWEKYQSADKLELIREQNRVRKQKQRDKSRDSHATCHGEVTQQTNGQVTGQVTPCHAGEEELRSKNIYKDSNIGDRGLDNIEPMSPPPAPAKQIYGMYRNVFLTSTEHAALMADFPNDYEQMIDHLSEYMKSSGKHYDDHAAVMRIWAKKDAEKAARGSNPFLDMLKNGE